MNWTHKDRDFVSETARDHVHLFGRDHQTFHPRKNVAALSVAVGSNLEQRAAGHPHRLTHLFLTAVEEAWCLQTMRHLPA